MKTNRNRIISQEEFKMQIQSISHEAFATYGKVLEGYDLADFLTALGNTPRPDSGVVYVASEPTLENQPLFEDLKNRAFGGMPIQIGYCNGFSSKLNCLEYHRDSEVLVTQTELILLVGLQSAMKDWMFDTAKVEAFRVPAGTAVELYATTLHYAPCGATAGEGFRAAICLPRGTNEKRPDFTARTTEDQLLTACNKWLLAHPDSGEAAQGAKVGLVGANIDLA